MTGSESEAVPAFFYTLPGRRRLRPLLPGGHKDGFFKNE